MTVEEKVIASVRRILLSDSAMTALVSTSIYASHISSINKPVYPAISIHLLSSNPSYDAIGYVDVDLQIDAWFPSQQYDMTHLMNLKDALRNDLQRALISDKSIPVVGFGYEIKTGSVQVEEDTRLLHLPVIYTFTAM